MSQEPPKFNTKFFCILNQKSVNLAALISSYIYDESHYTPIFKCIDPTTYAPNKLDEGFHEDYISVVSMRELDVHASNALNMLGGCEYLILGGLNDKQKSYFTFLNNYNIIEIENEEEVHLYLNSITNKTGSFKCNENSILEGLYSAARENSYIEIDNSEQDIILSPAGENGIVIVEDTESVAVISAINYCLSIGAFLKIIAKPNIDAKYSIAKIEEWKSGNEQSLLDLKAEVYNSIEDISLMNFSYATFFTIGIPYSLIIENIIPSSHVHLYLNPERFIFNSIYYETNYRLASSIVFSPLEFVDEETVFVKNQLLQKYYNVKSLIGNDATVNNLDSAVRELPYNILHICSHGGEISGFEINENFTDRDGKKHSVKYDEVVSYAPAPGKEMVRVTIKRIIREFDGFDWRKDNKEKSKNESYVYADMHKAISGIEKPTRIPKDIIPDSCSIKCVDFIYQAMFNTLASTYSPLIFNNTCQSWYEIAQAFISSGARGYIGTLWNVDNSVASKFAESFYESLFNSTVLNSLFESLKLCEKNPNENIYIYWGLHFTTMPVGESIENSRMSIAEELLKSLDRWKQHKTTVENQYIENIDENIKWIASELSGDFLKEARELIIRIE